MDRRADRGSVASGSAANLSETSGAAPSTLALVGYLMGPFLSMVDSSIVNVALVDISKSLSASLGDTQWVVSSYLLAMSAALPLTAWLSRRFTATRVFAASIAGFTLSSVFCGFSPTLGALVTARTLQGLFGAFLIPLAMTKLLRKEVQEQGGRGSIPSLFGLILFMAPAIAPSIGGLLLRAGGWPLIFFINVPFGIFGLWIVLRNAGREERHTAARFDFVGLLLLSVGLAGVTYGSSQGTAQGWFSISSLPFWIGGFCLVVVYGIRSARAPAPAVSLRSLALRRVAAADLITMLTSVAAFGMIILSLVFLQDVRDVSALTAGLAMIPQALLTGIGTGISPKLVSRFGVRSTAAVGLVLLGAGTLLLVETGPATSVLAISLMLTGRAFAIGLVIQPLTMMINGAVPEAERTDANTLFMICQRLGGAFGVSIIITFFQRRTHSLIPSLGTGASYQAFHESVILLTLVAVLALAISLAMLGGRERIGAPASAAGAGSTGRR